ncbi:hypothetical protein HDK90DRAFT_485480, partial [Phyllosticta capitalensis]
MLSCQVFFSIFLHSPTIWAAGQRLVDAAKMLCSRGSPSAHPLEDWVLPACTKRSGKYLPKAVSTGKAEAEGGSLLVYCRDKHPNTNLQRGVHFASVNWIDDVQT